jgi:hypothetical protein
LESVSRSLIDTSVEFQNTNVTLNFPVSEKEVVEENNDVEG